MGDPVSMGMGVMGGGVLQAAGGIFGGLQANQQSRKDAHALKAAGRVAAEDERRLTRDLIGAQRAASTTSDANSGSALDLQLEAAVEGELAALRAQFGFNQQAESVRDRGRAALNTSLIQGATSMLGSSLSALSLQPGGAAGGGGLDVSRLSSGGSRTSIGGNSHLMRFANVG